jgi:hypothetical protein
VTTVVTASPASVTADGSSTTLTVTVRDAFGNVVPGQTVTLDATGSSNTLVQPSAPTDAGGQASGTLASTKAEAKTVTATVGAVLATTTVAFVAGSPAAARSLFVASPASIPADGITTSTLTLTLADQYGNVVANLPVTVSSTGSANTLTPSAGQTDATGTFSATLSSTTAESKAVTAVAGGLALTANVTVAPPGLPLAGLVAWLDADDPNIVVDGASGITQWPNKASGGLGPFTPLETTPILSASTVLTPHRTAHFSSGEMISPTSDLLATDHHSIFVVAVPSDTAEDDLVGTDSWSTSGDALLMIFNGHVRGHYWYGPGLYSYTDSSDTVSMGNATVVAQVVDGTDLRLYHDSAAAAVGTVATGAPPGASKPVTIGHRCPSPCYGSGWFQGEIAEVLVYDVALSDTDRAAVFTYLNNKWGLPRVTTSITSENPSAPSTNSNAISFTLSSNSPGATFTCSLDSAAATPCSSTPSYTGLAEGNHSFVAVATAGGVTDPVGAVYYWKVDLTPPSLGSISSSAGGTSFTVTWTTNEPATTEFGWAVGSGTLTYLPEDMTLSTVHTETITGLQNLTIYTYAVGGHDAATNEFWSALQGIRTTTGP